MLHESSHRGVMDYRKTITAASLEYCVIKNDCHTLAGNSNCHLLHNIFRL
jgi:hypothetical protein